MAPPLTQIQKAMDAVEGVFLRGGKKSGAWTEFRDGGKILLASSRPRDTSEFFLRPEIRSRPPIFSAARQEGRRGLTIGTLIAQMRPTVNTACRIAADWR